MAYTCVIATDADIEDQFRAILGVTALEFSDTEIALLPILPAAELEVIKAIPAYATILSHPTLVYDLKLAVLYLAADNAVPSLRLKLLELETDNKSTAQRFRKALDVAQNFKATAYKYISNVLAELSTTPESSRDLFEISSPATDVITGAAQ